MSVEAKPILVSSLFWISFYCLSLTCRSTVILVLLRVPIKCIYLFLSVASFSLVYCWSFLNCFILSSVFDYYWLAWFLCAAPVVQLWSRGPHGPGFRDGCFRSDSITLSASRRLVGFVLPPHNWVVWDSMRDFSLLALYRGALPSDLHGICEKVEGWLRQALRSLLTYPFRIFWICVSSSCGSWPVRTWIMLWSMSFGWCCSCLYFNDS